MRIENLYEPFEIELAEVNDCPMPHRHNFFELVYVVEGTGVQCINENKLSYQPEKLFLLMPQDCHSFEIKTTTKFFFIRFNDIYLQSQDKEWIGKLEFIFQNYNHMPGCILKNKTDKPFVKSLVEALIREHVNRQQYHLDLVKQIVNTMITIVARNVSFAAAGPKPAGRPNEAAAEMLNYIHRHIYSPEQLRAELIAAHFNISPTYISEYFKKAVGEGLQQYITSYKMKLVETRLRFSELRMNEIAYELGFTDESHLTKAFRKHRGMNPTTFRKNARM